MTARRTAKQRASAETVLELAAVAVVLTEMGLPLDGQMVSDLRRHLDAAWPGYLEELRDLVADGERPLARVYQLPKPEAS